MSVFSAKGLPPTTQSSQARRGRRRKCIRFSRHTRQTVGKTKKTEPVDAVPCAGYIELRGTPRQAQSRHETANALPAGSHHRALITEKKEIIHASQVSAETEPLLHEMTERVDVDVLPGLPCDR